MKYSFIPFLLLLLSICSLANDGAFRASGNQLIPMYETDISVKKEILTIRRINEKQARVEVYYEFFNPKEAKILEVGFEAVSPSGDVDHYPTKDGHQPYIRQFTVTLNEASIPYKVAIVHDKLYYRAGQYKAISLAQANKESEEDYVDFFYVYHFRASFRQGLNIIRHSYIVDLSNSVGEHYSLDYILTAARRWANRQIDNFTLQIDMGEFQDLSIEPTFFKNVSEWKTDSTIKSMDVKTGDKDQPDMSRFFIRKGAIVFTKLNFKPKGELEMHSFNSYYYRSADRPEGGGSPEQFDSRTTRLPFSIDDQDGIYPPVDELSKKILHNLPFARRGYVFKSPEIAAYYTKQPWYLPDPTYTPDPGSLTKQEQDWLAKNK